MYATSAVACALPGAFFRLHACFWPCNVEPISTSTFVCTYFANMNSSKPETSILKLECLSPMMTLSHMCGAVLVMVRAEGM